MNFLSTEIWRIKTGTLPNGRAFLIRMLRSILFSIKGFEKNKCQLNASALTFYTLLSIVPIMAMAFGIAKGFGFEKVLHEELMARFEGQESTLQMVIDFSNRLLEQTKGEVVAGIGFLLLCWSVMSLLENIESSFNDIFGVKQHRIFARKFTDYISIILICPILILLSGSFTVFIAGYLQSFVEGWLMSNILKDFIFLFVGLTPYIVTWVLFSFIYIVMPNTRVNGKSALIAGVVAGTLYQLAQYLYITFQWGLTRYNAIYGSFAALPFFLVWLQISWIIVLFGAELSFALQNEKSCEFEPDCLKASRKLKNLAALRIVNLIIKYFVKGLPPLNEMEIASLLDMPIRLARTVTQELLNSGLLSVVKVGNNNNGLRYQPSASIEKYSIKYVLGKIDSSGSENIPIGDSPEFIELAECMNIISGDVEKSTGNKLLKDI